MCSIVDGKLETAVGDHLSNIQFPQHPPHHSLHAFTVLIGSLLVTPVSFFWQLAKPLKLRNPSDHPGPTPQSLPPKKEVMCYRMASGGLYVNRMFYIHDMHILEGHKIYREVMDRIDAHGPLTEFPLVHSFGILVQQGVVTCALRRHY